jgi:hypothetical protein
VDSTATLPGTTELRCNDMPAIPSTAVVSAAFRLGPQLGQRPDVPSQSCTLTRLCCTSKRYISIGIFSLAADRTKHHDASSGTAASCPALPRAFHCAFRHIHSLTADWSTPQGRTQYRHKTEHDFPAVVLNTLLLTRLQ